MPSEVVAPPITSPDLTFKPTESSILKGLQSADSPLDFIKKNLATNPSVPSVEVPRPKEEVPAAPLPVQKDPEPQFNFDKKDGSRTIPENNVKTDEQSLREKVGDERTILQGTDTTETDEDAEFDAIDSPQAENFKKLRTKFKATKETLKAIESEKERLAQTVEDYTTGRILPEVLQQKENEIARLSQFEKLHNLKMSSEYQESYIKPLDGINAKLEAIVTDYGLPKEVISEALNTKSVAELNRFLSEHFDDVGALEVKSLVRDAQTLQAKAIDAEAKPAETLRELQEQHEQLKQVKEMERKNSIASSAKKVWVDALLDIRKDNRAIELIRRDNDHEHNAKYVDPILNQAAAEYGKFITGLADAGIHKLPDDLGRVLAKAFLLAHASAIALESRTAALSHADQIESNAKRVNGLIRPPIGGGTPSNGHAPRPQREETPVEAARGLLSSVLGRR